MRFVEEFCIKRAAVRECVACHPARHTRAVTLQIRTTIPKCCAVREPVPSVLQYGM